MAKSKRAAGVPPRQATSVAALQQPAPAPAQGSPEEAKPQNNGSINMNGLVPPELPANGEIPDKLKISLFKQFWIWLGIVGAAVVLVASGFAVIASQAINSLVSERIETALTKISNVEQTALTKIDTIEKRTLDSAFETTAKSAAAAAAAAAAKVKSDEAEKALVSLNARIKEFPNIDDLLKKTQEAANALATNPQFIKDTTDKLRQDFDTQLKTLESRVGELALNKLDFSFSIADGGNQQTAACPAGAKFIAGTCNAPPVGDDSKYPLLGVNTPVTLQSITCQRYANARVQAIAFCARPYPAR